jgi:Respiratory-chain NADH dehydrogenase, 30 Kd subunit
MDGDAFLAKVRDYHEAGWRLAIINVTTIVAAAAPAHGAPAAASAPAASAAPEAAGPEAAPVAEAPGVFEIAWGFVKDGNFETIREQIHAGDTVPSISEFFGAAFLYENEIRELFGINVTGIGVDLRGQLYKTATRVPFAHAAIKDRLAKNAAAAAVKRS